MGAAQLSWAEELDLLTRFHPGNAAFSELGMMVEVGRDDCQADRKEEGIEGGEEEYNSAHNTNKQTNMKNIGRGRKLSNYQKDDDCFIAQQIEKTLGSGHRAESIFNSSQTSTKTEKSLEKMSTPQKSSSCSSSIQKNAVVSVTGPTVIRAKLSKKNSTGVSSDVEASIMKEFKALGIGRGRGKPSPADALRLVGAAALKMTKNGEKKQSKHLQEDKNNNNNNNNYFPTFDYDGYNKIIKASHWWAGNPASSGIGGKQEVLKNREENVVVVVERDELSKWTPLDNSARILM